MTESCRNTITLNFWRANYLLCGYVLSFLFQLLGLGALFPFITMSPWGWKKKQWKIKFKSVYFASHYVLIYWRNIDLWKSLVKLMSVYYIPLIFIIHHVPFPSTTNNWALAVFLQNIKEKKKLAKNLASLKRKLFWFPSLLKFDPVEKVNSKFSYEDKIAALGESHSHTPISNLWQK